MATGRKLESLAERVRPLGHPLRLALLARLADAPDTCVCRLAAALAVGQPAVSHHLGILRRAGLVVGKRDGGRVGYSIENHVARVMLDGLRDILEPAPHEEGQR